MSHRRMKQVSVVMTLTVVSKCLGFLRDVVLAYYFGSGIVTDAYFVSQTIPEFLFSLVVQAIAVGFIPIYTDIVQQKSKQDADTFTNNVIKCCLIGTVALVVVVNLFSREIVSVFASGFGETAMQTAIRFVRITVIAMFFRIVVAVYTAYLHANDHFLAPAFNGIVLDIAVIASIVVAFYTDNVVLAIGLVVASFLQLVLLFPFTYKRKPRMTLSPKGIVDDDVKRLVKMLFPVLLGVGAHQINVLADRTMASSITGAISSLNYANKVDNVLENIIILSLATVMFPAFSKDVANKDMHALKGDMQKSLAVVFVTMIPCSFLAFTFSQEVIHLLFGRGAFDLAAIESASTAMKFYSIGLVFLSVNAVLTRVFYSLKKVTVVSVTTCASVAVNIGLNFLLKPLMGIGGLALATSISNVFITGVLAFLLWREFHEGISKSLWLELGKALVSSLLMLAVSVLAYWVLSPLCHYLVALVLSCTLGGVIYLSATLIQKSSIILELLEMVKDRIHRKST